MRSLQTHDRQSNKIYNFKLTMTKNMKSSTVKRLGRSIENMVDFNEGVDVVKIRFFRNEGNVELM